MSERPAAPQEKNFKLQAAFLVAEQRRISLDLFERGIISGIVGNKTTGIGACVDVQGLGQFMNTFAPSLRRVKTTDGLSHSQLSLTAIHEEESLRTYSYFPLGLLDDHGLIYPYSDIVPELAEAVHAAAKELLQCKSDGLLTNLSYDLLDVDNPNHNISAILPPKEL